MCGGVAVGRATKPNIFSCNLVLVGRTLSLDLVDWIRSLVLVGWTISLALVFERRFLYFGILLPNLQMYSVNKSVNFDMVFFFKLLKLREKLLE